MFEGNKGFESERHVICLEVCNSISVSVTLHTLLIGSQVTYYT